MINVKDKTCEYVGCNTQPTYNLPGQTKARFCSEHKQPNMVNVKDKKCGDLAMRWKKSRKKSTSVLPKTNFRLVARNLINTENRFMSKSNVSKTVRKQTVRKQTRMRRGVTIASLRQACMPHGVIREIGKRHPLLIPPFTNDTLRRAVQDYLAGGDRKQRIVAKYGEISNWDTSNVTKI